MSWENNILTSSCNNMNRTIQKPHQGSNPVKNNYKEVLKNLAKNGITKWDQSKNIKVTARIKNIKITTASDNSETSDGACGTCNVILWSSCGEAAGGVRSNGWGRCWVHVAGGSRSYRHWLSFGNHCCGLLLADVRCPSAKHWLSCG